MSSETTLDDAILQKYKDMTKHSSSPKQCAFIMKLNTKENKYEIEDTFDDIETAEDIAEELEEQCPRYVILYWRYEKDQREAFSVILLHYCPRGSPPQSNMIMSRSKQQLIDFFKPNRILEVRDAEDLTDEFLNEALLKN